MSRSVLIACVVLVMAAAGARAAGEWAEFRSLIPVAVECARRHPERHPKLAANVRKYQHRLSEADAIAAVSPALADRLIAKPLREMREELARCGVASRRRYR